MEKKNIKIAFINITQNLVERGAETFVYELSRRLNKNYQVEIITGNKLPPKRWPYFWRFFIDPNGLAVFFFTLKKIPRIFRERYDIIFTLNGGWQSAILRVITWLYGGKIIISGQSGKGWDDRNNLWCLPDVFVSLSEHLKKWAKKVNPFVKVVVIPNGVDINRFTPLGSKINFDLERPIILCVGALTDEKRIDLAIEAVSKIKQGSLVVIGSGQLKDRLNEMGKKLLGLRFLLTSSNFNQMPKYYRGGDLFTLPSPSYRSFEIVLVEAMACNLPVVANDDPIRREIVQDAGLYVNPENTQEYAEALQKALSMKWDKKPRVQAEKFSWDKIASQYELLFKELLR